MSEKVTLYWNIGSQPARAVKALLDIGNIDYQLVSKDIIKEETRTKEFLQLNPFGKIPFMIHGNFKIGQSNAILVYLCEMFPSIPSYYYGTNPQERAKTNMYLSWYQYYFRPALFKIIYLKVYGFIRKKTPFKVHQLKSAEKQMFQALKTFQMLLGQSKHKFVSGEMPTIADLLIYFQLTNIYYYGVEISKYELVWKWFGQVQKIKEVNKITQEWRPLAKGFQKMLASIKAQDQPKSSL